MKQNPFNELLQWASTYPVKTILFTFLFTIIPTILAFRDDLIPAGLAAGCIGLMFWIDSFVRWKIVIKRTATVLIAAALLASTVQQTRSDPVPDKPNSAALGVGIVVICVGGFCIYKVVKLCQKKFPPKTADTNSNDGFTAISDGEYGGACEYSSIGSCYEGDAQSLTTLTAAEEDAINPTTFTLNVMLNQYSVTTSMSANNKENSTQSWSEFQSEMYEHGLSITGHSSFQPKFESEGRPCDPSMVPLEFDVSTGRVTHRYGGELKRVVVERSPNLQDWYPLMVTDVGVGTGFQVVDTTRAGQMFYRVSMSQP
jgi:hypothetical protein